MADYVPDPDWREHLREDMRGLLDRLSAKGLDHAQRIVPVSAEGSNGNPPGYLRDSLRRYVSGETARWGSDVDYSVWVEEGHRVAYRKWATEGYLRGPYGEKVYTGEVVPPQPYLRPSLFELQGEAGAIIEEGSR